MTSRCTTSRRAVSGGAGAGSALTLSCASRGRTWRNQPTIPATAATAPSALTAALVASPANRSIAPNARTSGQGVDAGTSTTSGELSWSGRRDSTDTCSSSATDDVDDQEDRDPHDVDEMPVQTQEVDARGMLSFDVAAGSQQRDRRERNQADRHMEGVQPDEGVVSRSEQVGTDRQPFVANQVSPFERRAAEEDRPEHDGGDPGSRERTDLAPAQPGDCAMDRPAAREKADRQEHGKVQHAGGRTADALARLEQVRDNEDDEDRRLAREEREHSHSTAGRQAPIRICGGGAHSYFQSGSSGCLRSHSGRRLFTAGTAAQWYSGGGDEIGRASC